MSHQPLIDCSACGWRHTVPCGRDDCPHDLATVYATIARELDNAVANGCMDQLAKMSAEDIAYDLAQHSAACERIAIPILAAGVKAWMHPQDAKDRNNPEAIRERCRRAADRFVALAANARVDAVVSADLLLEAASLLKGYDQSLLVDSAAHAAVTARIAALEAENQRVLKLAKEATNGWACWARRKMEHEEIARIHKALALSSTAGGQ